MTGRSIVILFALCAAGARVAPADIPAFPGAEGFGAISVGGRGGDVYHVTSLGDPATLTPGTLRHAISTAPAGGRTIVFDISGNVHLTSDLHVNNPKITIAGQTAPGQGITLTGDSVWLEDNDLVVRYIRSRLTSTGGTQDSMSIQNGNRVVMDHCSTSWSADEITSMTHNSTDNTIQWSLITEALNSQNHSRSSLFRPGADAGAPYEYNLTVHHSLYAHSADRNPVFSTYNDKTLYTDFRNNVVFDWKNQATHTGDVESNIRVNFISNYYVAGLTTRSDLVADPSIFSSGSTDTWIYYNEDNLVDATRDDGLHDGIWDPTAINGARIEMATPFEYPAVTTQSASDAYDSVLNFAGSFWWNRDPVDDRVITDVYEISDPDPAVRAQSGTMLTTEADVGGLPILPVETRAAIWDTDQDGMPGYWEVEHGLDPNVADNNGDFDSDGYTNIEEYINDIGAFPAPQPIVWDGEASDRYAQIENWDIAFQPSRYDTAVINNGTVTVDAVGQHAGTLIIGSNPGDDARLDITAGWLKVEDSGVASGTGELIIGGDPAATATLSLSGGELSAALLAKGAGGTFSFTGGKLHADEVDFDLVNNGGTLAPGSSTGSTLITGDYQQLEGGTLEIEINSLGDFDVVGVDGEADLAGLVNVVLAPEYTPDPGDWFQILVAAGGLVDNGIALAAGGAGDLFTLQVDEEHGWVRLLADVAGVPGDYNGDGLVDAADYTVWRDTLGSTSDLRANGDDTGASQGVVDEADFLFWKSHFGQTAAGNGTSAAVASAAVPEPASLVLLAFGVIISLRPSQRR